LFSNRLFFFVLLSLSILRFFERERCSRRRTTVFEPCFSSPISLPTLAVDLIQRQPPPPAFGLFLSSPSPQRPLPTVHGARASHFSRCYGLSAHSHFFAPSLVLLLALHEIFREGSLPPALTSFLRSHGTLAFPISPKSHNLSFLTNRHQSSLLPPISIEMKANSAVHVTCAPSQPPNCPLNSQVTQLWRFLKPRSPTAETLAPFLPPSCCLSFISEFYRTTLSLARSLQLVPPPAFYFC